MMREDRELIDVKLYADSETLDGETQIMSFLKEHPENPSGYYHLARTLRQKGDRAEAIANVEEAMQRDPGNKKFSDTLRNLRNPSSPCKGSFTFTIGLPLNEFWQ